MRGTPLHEIVHSGEGCCDAQHPNQERENQEESGRRVPKREVDWEYLCRQ